MKKSEFIRVFRAFTDHTRVMILELLRGGEQCACVLLEDLEISQPTLSHHMKILCESGIVRSRKAGKWSYYTIDAAGCDHAKQLLDSFAEGKSGPLARLVNPARRLIRTLSATPGDAAADGCCCTRPVRFLTPLKKRELTEKNG
jgi:ArsR family transcriptional regulator